VTSQRHHDLDDQLAAKAEALDEALAAGEQPTLTEPVSDGSDTISALLAAQASLQLLERVWPRGGSKTPETTGGELERVPTNFGRFRIVKELGRGGFGVVFLAIDSDLNRPVALKLPLVEALLKAEVRHRFVREAKAAAALDHPNLVPLYEAGEIDSICYLASAYCEGPTLGSWLREQQLAVPPDLAARLVADMASAVQHSHERGVLHRDLKPSNIMIEQGGSSAQQLKPRITDFGLARLMERPGEETTASFAAMGSAPYMAPEQAEGKKVGATADIYSLGAILYALLCARPPHRGTNELDTLRLVINTEPATPRSRRPEVPRDLEAICLKCLEKDPSRRYASAQELADDLHRFLDRRPTRARPPTAADLSLRWIRRHPATLVPVTITIAFTALLFGATRWAGNQLDQSRLIAEHLEKKARSQDQEIRDQKDSEHHLLYVSDMRLADRLVREYRTPRALEILERYRAKPGEDDLREFVWYYLLKKCHGERRTLTGHRDEVYHVEFSPKGDRLASTGKDGMVLIWDTASWTVVRTLPSQGTESNVATFSPDGRTLATSGDDGLVRLWDIGTGELQQTLSAHPGKEGSVQYVPDARSLLTGSQDGVIKRWDARTGIELEQFRIEGSPFRSMALSPDGTILAAGGRGRTMLWNLASRTPIKTLDGHQGRVLDVAFSHDGKRVATTGEVDHTIRLYEVFSGRYIRSLQGHGRDVRSVKFVANDRFLASCGDDLTIRTWDVASGYEQMVSLGHTERIWGLSVSPDGQTAVSASADRTIKVWDFRPPGSHTTLPIAQPASFGFTPENGTLFSLEVSPWSLARWDVDVATLLARTPLDVRGDHLSSAFSPDGKRLATASTDGTITLWDPETGRREGELDEAPKNVNYLEFSADHRRLLVHNIVRGWTLWDVASGRQIPFPYSELHEAIFTPTGEIFGASETGDFLTWNLVTGQHRKYPVKRPFRSVSPTISSNGQVLAVADPDARRIHIASAVSFDLRILLPENSYSGGMLALTPDGRTLAVVGPEHTVKLWDVATGEELLTLEIPTDQPRVPCFSPNGAALAVSTWGYEDRFHFHLWHTARDDYQTSVETLQSAVTR
jgi:eukaryotic-like serine/threonine-protein kinase